MLLAQVVAIHGGLDQEERHEAIRSFKEGSKDRNHGISTWQAVDFVAGCGKDVLIGTDVASKGLDFPAIQHDFGSAFCLRAGMLRS